MPGKDRPEQELGAPASSAAPHEEIRKHVEAIRKLAGVRRQPARRVLRAYTDQLRTVHLSLVRHPDAGGVAAIAIQTILDGFEAICRDSMDSFCTDDERNALTLLYSETPERDHGKTASQLVTQLVEAQRECIHGVSTEIRCGECRKSFGDKRLVRIPAREVEEQATATSPAPSWVCICGAPVPTAGEVCGKCWPALRSKHLSEIDHLEKRLRALRAHIDARDLQAKRAGGAS